MQNIIVDKTPEQMRFQECMWTRNNIRQLIREKYGIAIKLSTLRYYPARWGFTVQQSVKRAEQEGAEIFFGEETNTHYAT